jgi:hypothetical protein
MKKTWLVQRLKKPFAGQKDNPLTKLLNSNPFAFGGGLVNGGFRPEAMKVLSEIFSFDYMGSAEFEWGACPEAFSAILKRKDNCVGELRINKIPIYYFCSKADEDEVRKRIHLMADNKLDLKEWTGLDLTTDEVCKNGVENLLRKPKFIGWVELDNGFFFFTDKEAFDKLVALLMTSDGNAKK